MMPLRQQQMEYCTHADNGGGHQWGQTVAMDHVPAVGWHGSPGNRCDCAAQRQPWPLQTAAMTSYSRVASLTSI